MQALYLVILAVMYTYSWTAEGINVIAGSGSNSNDTALPAPQIAAPRPPLGDASAYR